MDEKYAQLWQKLSAALKPQVSPDTFKRWFSAVKLVQATDEAFTFRVPNNIYQFWIESNHMAALQAAIVTALGVAARGEIRLRLSKRDWIGARARRRSPGRTPPRENARDAKQSSNALGLESAKHFRIVRGRAEQ